MSLRVCGGCRRHVRDELACPFCGASVTSSPRQARDLGRISRAAAFAGGLLGGCYTDHPAPQSPPPPPPHVEPQPTGATIEGVITDTSGARVVQQRITLRTYRGGAEVMQIAETDKSGHYAFTGLPAGKYIVGWASGDPRRQGQFEIVLGEHEKKQLDGVVERFPAMHQAMPYGAPPARRRVV